MKVKFIILSLSLPVFASAGDVQLTFDLQSEEQTVHSFGASDCWRVQYVGKNWPEEKREKIADLLFSQEYDENGNPRGIGLSLWRFNIGSGSHEAGINCGVASEWRRTECFLDSSGKWDWNKQAGQRWFLDAAKTRGVRYSLGFSLTAPYFMTKNGMTRADKKDKFANISENAYDDYASFMAEVSNHFGFDYLSPINEPQWEWVSSRQEGMQATNEECSRLIHLTNSELQKRNAKTQIVFGEAGDIRYLYRSGTDKADRDNQIVEIFSSAGKYSISGLSHVAPVVSGHSYWSTWPLDTMVNVRRELYDNIKKELPDNYTYWQTEYCPMERNPNNPLGGGGRDLTMKTALYVARVIHNDLTVCNASSWQWWTALSEWDYKDGLVFIDDGELINGASNGDECMIETCKYDGAFRTSKLLWALGNYSFFIRPGMVRVSQKTDGVEKDVMASAYMDSVEGKIVVVIINDVPYPQNVNLVFDSVSENINTDSFKVYETSSQNDLRYKGETGLQFTLSPNSITTLTNY